MRLTKLTIAAALATTALTAPQPANAFFGFVCIPRLQNCWCTYIFPCPVFDPAHNANVALESRLLSQSKQQLKETNKTLIKNTQSMGGEIGGLAAGLNAIGFNFEDLVSGQVDQLNSLFENLQQQMESVALSAEQLTSVINGSLDPSVISNAIREAGLTAFDLEKAGLSQATINGLLNGSLSTTQVFETVNAFGMKGDFLKGIGITPDAINDIASGALSLDQLEQSIRRASGLSDLNLGDLGVDLSSLQTLSGSLDTAAAMNMIGQLGVGSIDTLSNLSQIDKMISGAIDSSQIFSIAGSLGVDMAKLRDLGVSPETISAFTQGSFSASQLVEISSALGIQGDALSSLGIDKNLIMSVASGDLSMDGFIRAAQQSGLTSSDLAIAGIQISELSEIAGQGNISDAIRIIDKAGLANNPLANIGISAETLAGVIDGSTSPIEIGNILSAAGIDPAAIVIPRGDGTSINGLGEIVDEFTSSFNIPVDAITGLRDAIDQAAGISATIPTMDGASVLAALSGQANIDLTSPQFMQNLTNGNIRSNELLEFLGGQGLGPDQLRAIGVSRDTLDAFRSGSFNPNHLLEFSRNLGIGSNAMEALGVGPTSLRNVATGAMSPDQYFSAARSIGLDANQLSQMGLSTNAIQSLAQTGDISAADALSRSASGAPAASTAIPLATGSPLAAIASNNAALSPTNVASIGETCDPQPALLTEQSPPNFFGDDVATIDMSLSQGDPQLYEEAIADAARLAGENQAHILARSITLKPKLKEAITSIDSYAAEIQQAETIEDDFRINAAIKTQLLMANAEITSLYTYFASGEAAEKINPDHFTEVPTFPHGSEWAETVAQSASENQQATANAISLSAEATDAYGDFSYQAKKTQDDYDLLVRSRAIQASMPDLTEIIQEHEKMKSHLHLLEGMIRQASQELYVDHDAAADRILSHLQSSSVSYTDTDKWDQSYNEAVSLDASLRSSSSRFGQRIVIPSDDPREGSHPSQPTARPYSYPTIDSEASWDPYRIVMPPNAREEFGRDDGNGPPPPLVGLFQYYLEAWRREGYFGAQRRGEAPDTMTARVWNELATFSPECLVGPIETTPENITARPDLFDLSPSCQHLTWEDADSEDYISSSELGGADSTLWRSKIDIDRTLQRTGGEEAVIRRAQDLIESSEQGRLVEQISEAGMTGWAQDVTNKISILRHIAEHTDFSERTPVSH